MDNNNNNTNDQNSNADSAGNADSVSNVDSVSSKNNVNGTKRTSNINSSVNERLKYLRAFIVLIAGLAMMVCDFVTGRDLTISLVHLLLVLLVFWILANIVVWVIKKALEMPTKEQLEDARMQMEQAENAEPGEEQETGAEEV
ncbi:MAG: hypothetical protein K2G89_06170 [Lachnospiraceae bacterium]|nr:hypothetical protein [Lachnospiraceae bacterium]